MCQEVLHPRSETQEEVRVASAVPYAVRLPETLSVPEPEPSTRGRHI